MSWRNVCMMAWALIEQASERLARLIKIGISLCS